MIQLKSRRSREAPPSKTPKRNGETVNATFSPQREYRKRAAAAC